MGNRYLDWLRQAKADLRHAQNAFKDGDFEWSCFAAHQSAEKSIKSVFLKNGMEAWEHTLTVLIGNLASVVEVPQHLSDYTKALDKHYIPTRYPNGFDSGAPTDFYTESDAKEAIKHAESIFQFCDSKIK